MRSTSLSKKFLPSVPDPCGWLLKRKRPLDDDETCLGTFATLRSREIDANDHHQRRKLEQIFSWLDQVEIERFPTWSTLDGSSLDCGHTQRLINNSSALNWYSPLPITTQQPLDNAVADTGPTAEASQRLSAQEASASYFAPIEFVASHSQVLQTPTAPPTLHSFVIGNLGHDITSSRLHAMFKSLRYMLPSFRSATVVHHPFTGESLGYAKVLFQDERDKQWAVCNLQGLNCGGNRMHIYPTTYQTRCCEDPGKSELPVPTDHTPTPVIQSDGRWVVPHFRGSNSSGKTLSTVATRSPKSPRDFHEINWPAQLKRQADPSSDRLYEKTRRLMGGKRDSSENDRTRSSFSLPVKPQKSMTPVAAESIWERLISGMTPSKLSNGPHTLPTRPTSTVVSPLKGLKLADLKLLRRKRKKRENDGTRSDSNRDGDVFRRRVTIPGEKVEEICDIAGKIDVFAMPEHLPSSPMCPANPRHRGSRLECPYHGPKRRPSL